MGAGHGEKQTRKGQAAIAALLTSPTLQKAAEKAGVAESTLRRWIQDPEFSRAYRDARTQLVESAIGRLQKASSLAVSTLKRNLKCGRPADEIRAAGTIISHAVHAIEQSELLQQLAELRQLLDQRTVLVQSAALVQPTATPDNGTEAP